MTLPPAELETLSYETAFAELETIVLRLENESPSLEEAIGLFERGQLLAQRCAQLLDQAELKLRTLTGQDMDALTEESDL